MASIKKVLSMAEASAKTGDLVRAVSLYRQILTKVPKHSKAKKELARLERQSSAVGRMTQADAHALLQILKTGNFTAAQRTAKNLSQSFPNEPFVFNILGYASGMLGEEKAAVAAYKWAIKLNPNFVEALSNYGSYLVQLGKLDQAVEILIRAVTKKPDYAEAHHNLGIAYFTKDEFSLAQKHYDRAIAISPKYANALHSRGTLRVKIQDNLGAEQDFRAALELAPKDALVLAKLGGLLERSGNPIEGFALMKQAIDIAPQVTDHHFQYAVALKEAGERAASLSAFEELLAVDPSHAEAYRLMADLQSQDALPEFTTRIKALFNSENGSAMNRVHLGFALGYIYEKTGKFKQSFNYLEAANSTYRNELPAMPETDVAKFKRINQAFADGNFTHLQCDVPSNAPIFIVGLMRSGTSLVEQIIATHSQVFGAGELNDITELSKPIYRAGRLTTSEDAQYLAQTYLDRMAQRSDRAAHCIDKMPGNFFNVGLIKTIFPNAKIINTVRDPRDNCFSIYKNFFDTYSHQYAYDQVELANFANDYKRMMNMWDKMFPGAVYHVSYEDLVADQENGSRQLLNYLDLPWEDQVLEFHKNTRAVRTASVNQVRQKIYKSSVKAWQNYEPYLGPLIQGLNGDLWADAMIE